MNTQFITPIQLIQPITQIGSTQAVQSKEQNGQSFQSIFQSLYQDARTSEVELAQKEYLLATGQIDDAHQVPIAAAKAELATNLLVQVRNKAMDGYNELMRISL